MLFSSNRQMLPADIDSGKMSVWYFFCQISRIESLAASQFQNGAGRQRTDDLDNFVEGRVKTLCIEDTVGIDGHMHRAAVGMHVLVNDPALPVIIDDLFTIYRLSGEATNRPNGIDFL